MVWDKFSSTVTVLGFKSCIADNSLFAKGSNDSFVITVVYVDDIILDGANQALPHQTHN